MSSNAQSNYLDGMLSSIPDEFWKQMTSLEKLEMFELCFLEKGLVFFGENISKKLDEIRKRQDEILASLCV